MEIKWRIWNEEEGINSVMSISINEKCSICLKCGEENTILCLYSKSSIL